MTMETRIKVSLHPQLSAIVIRLQNQSPAHHLPQRLFQYSAQCRSALRTEERWVPSEHHW